MSAFKGMSRRAAEQTVWAALVGLVVLLVAGGMLAGSSGASSTSSTSAASTIPAERLTPFGCDTAGYAECTDRYLLWKMCGIDILGDHVSENWVPNPLVSGGHILQYSYRGEPALEEGGDFDHSNYTCLLTGKSLTLTHEENGRLGVAGTKADIPPAVLQMLAESKN